MVLVTYIFVVSTLVHQSLYGDYCTTYRSCDFMVTLNSLNLRCYGHRKIVKQGFRFPKCQLLNPCLLKLVYSLWHDRLVMCLYGDLKLAIFKIVLATLKTENMVFGNLSLCGVNSCVSKLYEDYCTTHESCGFMVTVNSLFLRCYGHLKI